MHVHIEAITRIRTLHIAKVDVQENATYAWLESTLSSHGERWFPPDVNPVTSASAIVLINDDLPNSDGCTSIAQAEEWIRDGHSMRLGPREVSSPDVKKVCWLSPEYLRAHGESVCGEDFKAILAMMDHWQRQPKIITTRLVFWSE